jgi:hypothetical protein
LPGVWRSILAAASLGIAAAFGAAPLRADELPVDLELVLAVDVSDSMTWQEQILQRRGYIAALTDPDVVDAIRAGRYGRIAVAYVEWAAPGRQHVVVPWTLVDDAPVASAVADRLRGPPSFRVEGTSISSALAFSAALFEHNGFAGDRLAIDVSGDGPNNMGPPVAPVRDRLVRRGITINGLPILIERGAYQIPDVEAYYRDCVIGGSDAFLVPANGVSDFERAVRRKLTLEIAGMKPQALPVALRAPPHGTDCLIGERMGGGP